jgi:cysteine-rich repeat protein
MIRSPYRLTVPVLLVVPALAALVNGCTINSETLPNPSTTASNGSTGAGGEGGSGGSGGAGGSGGILVEDVGTDACPGEPFALEVGIDYVLTGTTVGATDDFASFCGDTTAEADGADVVVELTLPEDGTFTLAIEGSAGYDPSIAIRRESCTEAGETEVCFDYRQDGSEKIIGHFLAGTYHVIVDGAQGTSGDFELTARFDAARCGDGVLNPAEEQCDPADISASDGCTDPGAPTGGCKFEAPAAETELCPGESIPVTAAGVTLLASEGHTTYGYTDDYIGSCAAGEGGVDRIYQIVPEVAGNVTITVGLSEDGMTPACDVDVNGPTCWDPVLYVRTTCDDTGTELDCSDGVDGTEPETITFPVTAGTPYFVFVDGFDSAYYSLGPFNLFISLTP